MFGGQKWKCDACTFEQNANNARCKMCYNANPFKVNKGGGGGAETLADVVNNGGGGYKQRNYSIAINAQSEMDIPTLTEMWECTKCHISNMAGTDKCSNCNHKR